MVLLVSVLIVALTVMLAFPVLIVALTVMLAFLASALSAVLATTLEFVILIVESPRSWIPHDVAAERKAATSEEAAAQWLELAQPGGA